MSASLFVFLLTIVLRIYRHKDPLFKLTLILQRLVFIFVRSLSLVDLNECSLYGMCHQLCTNEKGSYKCSCANGYLLEINRRSCKATGRFAQNSDIAFQNFYYLGLEDQEQEVVCRSIRVSH